MVTARKPLGCLWEADPCLIAKSGQGGLLFIPHTQLWLQALAPLGLLNPVLRIHVSELSLPNVFSLPSRRENPAAELSLSILLLPTRLWTRSVLDNNKKTSSAGKTFNHAWRKCWAHLCRKGGGGSDCYPQTEMITLKKTAESCVSLMEGRLVRTQIPRLVPGAR